MADQEFRGADLPRPRANYRRRSRIRSLRMADQGIRRADLPRPRADYRRRGTVVGRSRIRREKAAARFVQLVGLLGTLYTLVFGFLQVAAKTNPFSKAIFLVSLCIFALTVGFKIIVRNKFGNCAVDHIINCAIPIFGALGIVPIVSIILPGWLSCIIYVIWSICSLMVMAWNLNLLKRFKQRFHINGGRTLVEPQGPSNV